MKVLETGHRYGLANMDNPSIIQELSFINMLPDGTRIDGTTNEEVMTMLIDRMEYLNSKFPCYDNEITIIGLKLALKAQFHRTEDRIKRGVEGKHLA